MNILCYGDSNTWGYIPNSNGYAKDAIPQQYPVKDCWWHSLTNHNVYVNGLCGRCIAHENKWLPNRNASATLYDDIKPYKNLDVVFVQLGTNDCKSMYQDSAETIANNLLQLVVNIKQRTKAQIVLISPAQIIENTPITQKYYVGANEKTRQLDKLLKKIADDNGFLFISGKHLDIGEDGEHLTPLGHKQLSEKVSSVMKILENNAHI